jgi:hypothetical protein
MGGSWEKKVERLSRQGRLHHNKNKKATSACYDVSIFKTTTAIAGRGGFLQTLFTSIDTPASSVSSRHQIKLLSVGVAPVSLRPSCS